MKKTYLLSLAVVFAACADTLIDFTPSSDDGSDDGIAFVLGVEEQADRLYEYGRTRAAGGLGMDADIEAANAFGAHPFEGSAEGLQVHRMPLPIMGIHPRTVAATDNATDASTRASIDDIVSDANSFHDSLTIWGFTDKGRTLFEHILLKKIRGWRSSVHWPYDKELTGDDAGKVNPTSMHFYAISPAMESLEDLTLKNSPAYGTAPQFSFIVPDEPASQRDLLYGESTPSLTSATLGDVPIQKGPLNDDATDPKGNNLGLDNKQVRLQFRHILTAVRFAQGKMPTDVTIKQIILSNIKKEATYDPASGEWSAHNTTTASYTIYPDKAITDYAPENVYIDGDSVLFLMPQTLDSDDAKLQLVIKKNGETATRRLTCSLKDDIWKPGYTVTYKVTIGEVKGDFYLLVDPVLKSDDLVKAPTDGGTYGVDTEDKYHQTTSEEQAHGGVANASFIIHSYHNKLDYSDMDPAVLKPKNKHYAANWKLKGFSMTYSSNSEDYTLKKEKVPDWLTGMTGWLKDSETASEQSGGDNITFNYSLSAQTGSEYDHSAILSANNTVSSYDLSTHRDGQSTAQTTANCYIVNADGNYSLPLVYGNAVEGGNRKIYSSGDASDPLNPSNLFLDAAGKPIKHASIMVQANDYDDAMRGDEVTDDASVGLTTEQKDQGWKKYKYTHTEYRDLNQSSTNLYSTQAIFPELIWQDYPGLFTVNVGDITAPGRSTAWSDDTKQGKSNANYLENSYGQIRFQVNSEKIDEKSYLHPGNALIALKGYKSTVTTYRVFNAANEEQKELREFVDDVRSTTADLLWVWHIWVTDEVYPNKANDDAYPSYSKGSKYIALSSEKKLLPVNLGWVPDEMKWKTYHNREFWVELEQVGSTEKVHLCIRQEAKQDVVTGTSTVYQWGRPTALPMVNTVEKDGSNDYGVARSVYNKNSTDISSTFTILDASSSANSVKEALTNPVNMIYWNANHWWDENADRPYWSTTKTLYDPCPPGFQVPASAIFSFMAMKDEWDGTEAPLNKWGTETKKEGAYIYAKPHTTTVPEDDRYLQSTYFATSGYYSGNSNTGTMHGQHKELSWGHSWTSNIQSNAQHAIVMSFGPQKGSNGLVKLDKNVYIDALPIRPVAE